MKNSMLLFEIPKCVWQFYNVIQMKYLPPLGKSYRSCLHTDTHSSNQWRRWYIHRKWCHRKGWRNPQGRWCVPLGSGTGFPGALKEKMGCHVLKRTLAITEFFKLKGPLLVNIYCCLTCLTILPVIDKKPLQWRIHDFKDGGRQLQGAQSKIWHFFRKIHNFLKQN